MENNNNKSNVVSSSKSKWEDKENFVEDQIKEKVKVTTKATQ